MQAVLSKPLCAMVGQHRPPAAGQHFHQDSALRAKFQQPSVEDFVVAEKLRYASCCSRHAPPHLLASRAQAQTWIETLIFCRRLKQITAPKLDELCDPGFHLNHGRSSDASFRASGLLWWPPSAKRQARRRRTAWCRPRCRTKIESFLV